MMKLRVGQSFLVATSLILFVGCPTASDMQASADIQLGEWVIQRMDNANNEVGDPIFIVLLDGGQTDFLNGLLALDGTVTWAINGTTFDLYQDVSKYNIEFFYTGTLLSPTSMQGTRGVRENGGVFEDAGNWTALYRYTSI
jgi:hypothetical protein